MPIVNKRRGQAAVPYQGVMPQTPAIPATPAGLGYSSPKMPAMKRLDQLTKMVKTGKRPGGARLWEQK